MTFHDPDKAIKANVLSMKHEIKGKYVDVKPAEKDTKRHEVENSNRKVFVGGINP